MEPLRTSQANWQNSAWSWTTKSLIGRSGLVTVSPLERVPNDLVLLSLWLSKSGPEYLLLATLVALGAV